MVNIYKLQKGRATLSHQSFCQYRNCLFSRSPSQQIIGKSDPLFARVQELLVNITSPRLICLLARANSKQNNVFTLDNSAPVAAFQKVCCTNQMLVTKCYKRK